LARAAARGRYRQRRRWRSARAHKRLNFRRAVLR
jgi:hypothetical protein